MMKINNSIVVLSCLILISGCAKNIKDRETTDAFSAAPYERLAENISYGQKYLSNKKVAVLPFSYTDKRVSNDGVVISERLLTLIINRRKLEVIERGLLEKVLSELKLQHSGAIDESSIKGIGKILGVEAVVTGTLTRHRDGRIEINARLIKTESAAVLSAAAETVIPDWETTETNGPENGIRAKPVALEITGAPAGSVRITSVPSGTAITTRASVSDKRADCPSGMVSYWNFNNNSRDLGSDTYTSRLIGGPVWTTGKVGRALSFDGVKDYVDCGSDPNLDLRDYITLEAWIKPSSFNTSYRVIVLKGNENDDGIAYGLQLTDDGRVQCGVGTTNPYTGQGVVADTPLNANVWSHVACTIASANSASVYVNGVLIKTARIFRPIPYRPAEPLYIGSIFSYKTTIPGGFLKNLFSGIIDEVAIYNRILSAEEIRHQYENGLAGIGYCSL